MSFPSYALRSLVVFLALVASFRVTAAQERPPNLVFILADDLGWSDLGVYGSDFYETSNLDALAAEGMRFTNAYATSPVCSPTRASILTGMHPARLRVTDWLPGRANRPDQRMLQVEDLHQLPFETITLAERLRAAGYATASIGKWHLGEEGSGPEAHGFDRNVAGNRHGYPPGYFYPYEDGRYVLDDLRSTGREGEHLTERLGEEAARFIVEHRERPFFLYLPFYAVHTPLETKEELAAKYRAKAEALGLTDSLVFGREGERKVRIEQSHAVYAGMVELLDASVGRVLESLEEAGVAERTIVVFTSDNGGLSTAQGHPTSNHPLRAGKGWLYEGGIREPLIVRWPGVTPAGTTTDVPVTSTDFVPTLLEAVGLARGDAPVDGLSLVPLLRGAAAPERDVLYWHYPHYSDQGGPPGSAIRVGDYKLIHWYEDGRDELFDLSEDPGEARDLSADLPEVTERLRERLRSWLRAVDAQLPVPNPDYEGAAGVRP